MWIRSWSEKQGALEEGVKSDVQKERSPTQLAAAQLKARPRHQTGLFSEELQSL
jgi:hypothetical protein